MKNKKFISVFIFIILNITNLTSSYSIEPDIFIQSTVNRAAKTLGGGLNKDERIKYVLIADTKNFLTLQNDLITNGWNEINIIKDTFYKTNISILEKNNIK